MWVCVNDNVNCTYIVKKILNAGSRSKGSNTQSSILYDHKMDCRVAEQLPQDSRPTCSEFTSTLYSLPRYQCRIYAGMLKKMA